MGRASERVRVPLTLKPLGRNGKAAMPGLAGAHLVEEAVGRWRSGDVAFIREIEFRPLRGDDGEPTDTELVLRLLVQPRPPQSVGWPDPKGAFWSVVIRFVGIRELCLEANGEGDIQIEGFQLSDITDHQWEEIKIEVEDYEGGAISFFAKRAEVLSCAKADSGPRCRPYCRQYPGHHPAQGRT